HKLYVIASLQDDRARACSAADHRTDHRTFYTAGDRSDHRADARTDTAAFDALFGLAVALRGAFGIDLYFLAVLIADRRKIAGKIINLTVAQRDPLEIERNVRPAANTA